MSFKYHFICADLLLNFYKEGVIEAGCDEAGRGCLAGPVFAAAVVLPKTFHHPQLNDSKMLSSSVRKNLRAIIERESLAWAVASVDPITIDEINILRASIRAMHLALDKLTLRPEHILVDGNHFRPYNAVPHFCAIKGDSKYASVAAASILAKTWRDECMLNLHLEFQHYGWDKNKGYPTSEHRRAIARFGPSPYHRRSFALYNLQTNFEFQ
jgi:ribonuclease HII